MNEIGNSNKRNTYINFYIQFVTITGEIELKALIPYCTIFHFYRTVGTCCSAGIFRQKLDFKAMCETYLGENYCTIFLYIKAGIEEKIL